MKYQLDEIAIMQGEVHIRGWVAPEDATYHIWVSVRNGKGQKVDAKITRLHRPDVAQLMYGNLKNSKLGFYVVMPIVEAMYLVFETRNEQGECVDKSAVYFKKSSIEGRVILEKTGLLKSYRYIKKNGFNKFVVKSACKLFHVEENNYARYFAAHKAKKEELLAQRETVFEKNPKISIAVPLYKTPKKFLYEMVQSVVDQTYTNWELLLANGSPDDFSLCEELSKISESDPRIIVDTLSKNLGIAGNTNAALNMATGDYIALLDHDDLLAPNALFEYVNIINTSTVDYDLFYSDEDKIDEKSKVHFEPNFKPDFNLDLFLTNNYICHFFMVKTSIVKKIGGFLSEYDGAQDYDFIMRCSEVGKNICHVPKILYYWRCHKNSTALNTASKSYAFEAGKRALQAHFDRMGLNVTAHLGPHFGWYSNEYHLAYEPLVTIMIPNKDHVEDLSRCLNSIYDKLTYKNFEILIIENNSTKEQTFNYYKELKVKHNNLKVVTYEGGFNYAAINNFGFSYANGEYVLLLNNDTEVISENLLEHMLGFAMRSDVGVVGAKLYYEDETIQHAGVVVGVNGIADHAFHGLARGELGYMARASVCQNYTAVTGACMMVRSSIYKELSGLDEENFAVAFNDIDFCLRVRKLGYLVVFDAEAEMYHLESKSRGYEDTPEKMERFSKEIDHFTTRYKDFLEKKDPYYNPNFNQNNAQYELDTMPVSIPFLKNKSK